MPPQPPRSRGPPRPGFSHRAPSTVSGRPRSHMRLRPCHPGFLVLMGGLLTSYPQPTPPVRSTNLGTPPTPFSGYPQHPSSSSCSPSAWRARMDTPELDRINTRDPTQRNRRNHRRSAQNSRMATASNTPRSHGHVQWTSSRDPSGHPSIATIPSWPLRKPSFHHYTLLYRVRVPFPPLQDPPPPSSPFAPPTLCTFLSVPSPSWPPRRPPRSMCSVRSLTSQRRPPWLIPLWYHHSPVQGSQGHEEGPMQVQPCRMPGGIRKELIQNCCKTEDAAWSSLASK